MRRLSITLLAALLATTAVTALARADNVNRGNPHGCVNPAGHVRGWCKQSGSAYAGRNRSNYVTISGTVLAINGDLAQFRQDSGTTITIDQRSLLHSGQPLSIGGHYTLRGYYDNDMFLAQANGGSYGANTGNGYPYPGSNANVHGIVTSISGSRVTIMQGLFSTITIDDRQALDNGTAQNLYVGRSITAYGYWNGGTFYATSIG